MISSALPPPPSFVVPGLQVFLVTYDLRTQGKVYTPLYESLKRQGDWWHYISSTWLLATTKSPQQVYNELAPHITTQDHLLIIKVAPPYWGMLPKDAWDWLSQHGIRL